MRIGAHHVVQLIESDVPRLVLVDERNGAEIEMIADEVINLCRAIEYFGPVLGFLESLPTEPVAKVEADMPWTQFQLVHSVLEAYCEKAPNTPEHVVRKNAIQTTKWRFTKR